MGCNNRNTASMNYVTPQQMYMQIILLGSPCSSVISCNHFTNCTIFWGEKMHLTWKLFSAQAQSRDTQS